MMATTRAQNERPSHERPSRPLSAYNYFFRHERQRLLLEKSDMVDSLGFTGMAKYIGKQWRKVDNDVKSRYQKMAAQDKLRYALEIEAWHKEQREFLAHLEDSESVLDESTHPKDEAEDTTPEKGLSQQSRKISQAQGNKKSTPNEQDLHVNKDRFEPIPFSASNAVEALHNNFLMNTHISPLNFGTSTLQTSAVQAFPMAPLNAFPTDSKSQHLQKMFAFDENQSLANMARNFGNDGIDYLLTVLVPGHDNNSF